MFVLLMLAAATPGLAQPPAWDQPENPASKYSLAPWRAGGEPTQGLKSPSIRLPIIEQPEVDGSRTRLRGVIVSTDVSPNVTIGLGLLSMKPRRSTMSADPALDSGSRSSRKAALRLTMKF